MGVSPRTRALAGEKTESSSTASATSLQHWKQSRRMALPSHHTLLVKEVPLYKKARARAYAKCNIEEVFKKYRIVLFNPRAVLSSVSTSSRAPPATTSSGRFRLKKTPNTKCELRQQTNLTLEFIKTATGGRIV